MLGTFFIAVLACSNPKCAEINHVIHPVPLTLEACVPLAQQVYDEFPTLVQAIGCKEQGKGEMAFQIIRTPAR